MNTILKEIPKDKHGFFDEDSDLYEQLPIYVLEMYEGLVYAVHYVDEENWIDSVADFSRPRFKYYMKATPIKEDEK